MTKAHEIELLGMAIMQFGKDSYIGATLLDQRDLIESDIRNDIMPLDFTALRKEEAGNNARLKEIKKDIQEHQEKLLKIRQQIDQEKRGIELAQRDKREAASQLQKALTLLL